MIIIHFITAVIRRQYEPHERGGATLAALLVMLVLTTGGTALLLLSRTVLQTAVLSRDGLAAQYGAEAGIIWAAARLSSQPELWPVSASQLMWTLPAATGKNLNQVTVQIMPESSKDSCRLIATAVVNQSRRRIKAVIRRRDAAPDTSNCWQLIWNN